MRVVVALGGNALLKRGEPMTAEVQRGNVRVAARALAPNASVTRKATRCSPGSSIDSTSSSRSSSAPPGSSQVKASASPSGS